MGGLFVPWTIRTMDYSCVGLFVRWTFRSINSVQFSSVTTNDSYYGLFVPFTNIGLTYATKANVYMCVYVSLLTLCAYTEVILALQITNVRCWYFVRINMFILSSHCCMFDAVGRVEFTGRHRNTLRPVFYITTIQPPIYSYCAQ